MHISCIAGNQPGVGGSTQSCNAVSNLSPMKSLKILSASLRSSHLKHLSFEPSPGPPSEQPILSAIFLAAFLPRLRQEAEVEATSAAARRADGKTSFMIDMVVVGSLDLNYAPCFMPNLCRAPQHASDRLLFPGSRAPHTALSAIFHVEEIRTLCSFYLDTDVPGCPCIYYDVLTHCMYIEEERNRFIFSILIRHGFYGR